MKAIILAAGFGNRMSPLTDNKHKTLIEVNGQTILDRIIRSLLDNQVQHIVIVTGYRSEDLVSFVANRYEQVTFEFVHNPRYLETNNVYSLALAFEQIEIKEDIILIESDLIYTSDVIEKVVHSKYENVALVSPYITGLDGTVVKITDNRITNIFPPHLQDEQFNLFNKYKTLNIYKFSARFCQNEFKKLLIYYAKVIDDNCYYELILGILIYMQRQDIYCEIIENHKWVEVDDPNDLKGAEFVFNKGAQLSILEDGFGGYWNYDIVDFCFIRNMYFPTKSMLAELKNNLSWLLENYGSKQQLLNVKLSYVLRCKADYLVVLNGAAQIYPILQQLFADKKVLIPDPSFGEYKRIFQSHDTYSDSVGIDLKEVELKISENEVVVFVNPNNPTGTLIQSEVILNYSDSYPDKFFIIDESFIEFSDTSSVLSSLEIKGRSNVLVIRSMSKSYGLPGVRLGFVYTTNEAFRKEILSRVPIWNMNSVAEFYMEIILKNKRSLSESFAKTKADREVFRNELMQSGVCDEVFPSGANFILFSVDETKYNADDLVEWLLNENATYIKDVSEKFNHGLKRYYRLAVRMPDENRQLTKLIAGYLKKRSNTHQP
jgi:histidinol-phosphate/aromatic aminotransferase/cobyric acid decarboxylase-like protein/choline kinase